MTPLLLLPGMMCDHRMWGDLPRALGPRAVRHPPCTEGDSMADLAARVLHGAPPRFALAGLSMGGIVAMEVLRQAPDRVERLALLDTNPLPETAQHRARRLAQMDLALAGRLAEVMQDDLFPHYLAQSTDKTQISALCLDMALTLGADVFVRQSRALRDRRDQQAVLATFTGPALVLMGAEDRLCPADRHRLMHRLMPQSRLAIIARAGHLPPLEQPAATLREIARWLSE